MEARIEKVEPMEAPAEVQLLLEKLGDAVDRLPSR
jgi:hypothetical protein